MYQPKNVSIDFDFFTLLTNYFFDHPDTNDPNYDDILNFIHAKLNALYRHQVYSTYKSDPSSHERSLARKEYLRLIGISDSFKWNDADDVNVNRS